MFVKALISTTAALYMLVGSLMSASGSVETTPQTSPEGVAVQPGTSVVSIVAGGFGPVEGHLCVGVQYGTKVLTVAHCITNENPERGYVVYMGNEIVGAVKTFTVHPNWSPLDIDSVDLVVLEIAGEVPSGNILGTPTFKEGNYLLDGTGRAIAVTELKDRNFDCIEGSDWTFDDSCWESPAEFPVCKGLSGSPVYDAQSHTIKGLVSWGKKGCVSEARWGAQRLDVHAKWLEENL